MKKLLLAGLCLGMYTITYCLLEPGHEQEEKILKQQEKIKEAQDAAVKAKQAKDVAEALKEKTAKDAADAEENVKKADAAEDNAGIGDGKAAEDAEKAEQALEEARSAAQSANEDFNQVDKEYQTAEQRSTDAQKELEKIQNEVAALSNDENGTSPDDFIAGLTGDNATAWSNFTEALKHFVRSVIESINFKLTCKSAKAKAQEKLKSPEGKEIIKNQDELEEAFVMVEAYCDENEELFKQEDPNFNFSWKEFVKADKENGLTDAAFQAITLASEKIGEKTNGPKNDKKVIKAVNDEWKMAIEIVKKNSDPRAKNAIKAEIDNINKYYNWVLGQ